MKKNLLTLLSVIFALTSYSQGNYVFSGGEVSNFMTVDLSTPGGQSWNTERSAAPGYFSAVNTATYTGASDAANINGYVKKYGNEAFTFTVGSGTDLRALSISSPASATDAYATAWIVGDPSGNHDLTAPNAGTHATTSVKAPIVAVSNAGQWDWQVGDAGNLGSGTTGTGTGLAITVSIPDMSQFAQTENLRLVGWDGASWIDLSGAVTASGNTENSTLSGTMVAGITAIAIGRVASLPTFKIKDFIATAVNCDAKISWTSVQEVNVSKYIIEQSTDGVNYLPVATVNAKGNAVENDYSIVVAQPVKKAYYRLKIADRNNTYKYSEAVECTTHCDKQNYMSIYPNPVIANGTVYLNFETSYQGKAILTVTNAVGQKVLNSNEQVNSGSNTIRIQVNRFAAGTYYISLKSVTGEQIGSTQELIKL